jgi:hypothetical protein
MSQLLYLPLPPGPANIFHSCKHKEVEDMFIQMRSAGHVTAFVRTTASRICEYIPFFLEYEYVHATLTSVCKSQNSSLKETFIFASYKQGSGNLFVLQMRSRSCHNFCAYRCLQDL